jgi:hypothetical protein
MKSKAQTKCVWQRKFYFAHLKFCPYIVKNIYVFQICKFNISIFYCRIWNSMDIIFCTASILSILLISFDRSLACFSPLSHYKYRFIKLSFPVTLFFFLSRNSWKRLLINNYTLIFSIKTFLIFKSFQPRNFIYLKQKYTFAGLEILVILGSNSGNVM